MREILFRGKRKDNGEWAYGYYVESVSKGSIFGYIKQSNTADDVRVYKKTVGQFTGLYDKTGTKKIFEGDIVHCVSATDEANMVVIFEDGEFRMVRCERYKGYISGWGFYAIRCFDKEIIGTIHENPELVK